jgi:glucokinase-like ROK family protein
MRGVNRSAILDLFRQSSPIARSEIARTLGLSQPTVLRIVDELVEEGMVRYTGETQASRGRRRDLLEYNRDGFAVVGVDLGGTKMFGGLANIGGEILVERAVDAHNTNGDESYTQLVELVGFLLDAPRKEGQAILGIAVGAPGVTQTRPGLVQWAPSLNWRDFPLKAKLEAQFGLPCLVENDVNLAALGENWFGAGQGTKDMVLIAIGTGVGAGIIMDGILLRGHHEAAGEIGYLLSTPDDLRRSYPHFGALENIISGTGIADRARKLLEGRLTADELNALTSSDVFAAARRSEDWAMQIVAETADYLSIAILNISTLLDPELIVLSGGVVKSDDLLLPAVQDRIRNVLAQTPRVEVSRLGRRAAVMGGIALTVLATSKTYVVRQIS